MLRVIAKPLRSLLKPSRLLSSSCDANLEQRYVEYFDRDEIDGWEARKAMNDLAGMDLVPEPAVITAALKACRRLDDYALAVRWLEVCRSKCGTDVKTIWPYLVQEIKPTLEELGVETPEELGYDRPELGLKHMYEVEAEMRKTGQGKPDCGCPTK